eukprot:12041707-Ditylum_brightwellii.AAC.1
MAERNGGIAQEPFGGRVRHSAEVQALNICLFYDQVKLNKVPVTSTFMDLVSNYDLMVHSIGIWYTQYRWPMVTPCLTIVVTSESSNCSYHHRAWVKGHRPVHQLAPSTAHCIIGIWMALDGNNKEQVKHCWKKTEALADRV